MVRWEGEPEIVSGRNTRIACSEQIFQCVGQIAMLHANPTRVAARRPYDVPGGVARVCHQHLLSVLPYGEGEQPVQDLKTSRSECAAGLHDTCDG